MTQVLLWTAQPPPSALPLLPCSAPCGGLRCLHHSLQQAATVDVLLFVCRPKNLDGLLVDQSPEVLKGNVLPVLHTHLLQKLPQGLLILCCLQQQTGSRDKLRSHSRREEKKTPAASNQITNVQNHKDLSEGPNKLKMLEKGGKLVVNVTNTVVNLQQYNIAGQREELLVP